MALLEELASRQAWTSDLWDAAFWRLNLIALPQEKLTWLLKVLETHFSDSPSLQGLSVFLFQGVDLSNAKRPSSENLDLLIRLSLLIWKQVRETEAAVTQDFKKVEWANRAINHAAGRIAEFWLKCCDLRRRESPQILGFPDWLSGPLTDMVNGADYASQLGRAILGLHLAFVYNVDPVWVGGSLFPKLRISEIGDEAFLLWEPHATFGGLSRELILVMPPIYREAFPHIRDTEARLQTGFFRHIAAIAYSCLVEMNRGDWLAEFLVPLSDAQRANWARQLDVQLRGAPEHHKSLVWQRWMRDYWYDRIHGRPCELGIREAEQMLDWVFVVGEAFPEAVDLVVQGPKVRKLDTVVYLLEKHEAPEKHPEALLRLLNWQLAHQESSGFVSDDIEQVIFRMPKKRGFLPLLNTICQRLASLGYARATDLKVRVEQQFIQN
jgi:hypothetical protein